jgi:hypothetical protein
LKAAAFTIYDLRFTTCDCSSVAGAKDCKGREEAWETNSFPALRMFVGWDEAPRKPECLTQSRKERKGRKRQKKSLALKGFSTFAGLLEMPG